MSSEQRKLMSEQATSRFCGVPVITIRKYREAGKITPTLDIPGYAIQYDAEAVKVFFDGNEAYQGFKKRAAGGKRAVVAA
jgi:hypothetical protein